MAVFRVATLNLWGRFADWPRRRALLAELLPPLAIDVLLLQEVVRSERGGDQLRELAGLLGFEWSARTIAESRPHETEEEGVAILSRLPLNETAVWPLPASRPPRHRLEATVAPAEGRLTVSTLHAAVSPPERRDAQIAALAELDVRPILVGGDLNAAPADVRRLVRGRLEDTLAWDEAPTWPVDAEEFVHAWEDKLGEKPRGEPEERRLDYLLSGGVTVAASGIVTLADAARSASDHRLVWADVSLA